MSGQSLDEKNNSQNKILNLEQITEKFAILPSQEHDYGGKTASSHLSETGQSSLRYHYLALKDSFMESGITREESDFYSLISKVEALHQLVQKPREQVADADALLDIANTLFSSIKSCENPMGVLLSDFISCLTQQYEEKVVPSDSKIVSWRRIGLGASHIFRKVLGMRTMIGTTDTKPTRRKAFAQRKRLKPADVYHPREVEDTSCYNNTEMDENISTMFNILKKQKCIQLEKLVLNRVSFSQTVENIFTLSFLAKDGRVEITVNDRRMHLVSLRNAPTAATVANGEVSYHHFIFKFDYEDWKLMIDNVGEGEEVMPHRTRVDKTVADQKQQQRSS